MSPMSRNQPDPVGTLDPSGTGDPEAKENSIRFACPGLACGANSRCRDLPPSRNLWAPWDGQAPGGKVATSDPCHMQGSKMSKKPVPVPWFL